MAISFRDYLNHRKNMSISEMAADPVEYTDKKGNKFQQSEIRKAPILFDQDDIEYLYQFPPQYWTQALTLRYGDLLRMAWEKISQGQKAPDVMNIKIKPHGRGSHPLIFPKIRVDLNKLYEKLTQDVDDVSYSNLDSKTKNDFLARTDRGGTYGFVLSNYKKAKGMGVSEGYVELQKNDMKKRLGIWLKSIQDGWFTRVPRGQERIDSKLEVVNFGGRNNKKMPVQGDKKYWKAIKNGKMVVIGPSHVPALKPAVMISSDAYAKFDKKISYIKRIREDFNSKKIDEYLSLLSPQKSKLITDRMDVLERFIEEKATSSHQKSRIEQAKAELSRLKKIRKIVENAKKLVVDLLDKDSMQRLNSTLSNLNSFMTNNSDDPNIDYYEKQLKNIQRRIDLQKLFKTKGINSQNFEEKMSEPTTFKQIINLMYHDLRNKAIGIQVNSKRYDIHDWNMHQFNPNLSKFHVRMRGLGSINPNWQQQESVHGSLKKLGINHEEFWKEMSEFLINIQSLEPEAIDPRVKRFGGNDFENVGSLATGINDFLKSPNVVRNRPVYFAMVKNWWQIFENASRRFQKLVGSRDFMRFLPKYKEFSEKIKSKDPNVVKSAWQEKETREAFEEMKNGAKRWGKNYAQGVFQLKSRQFKSANDLSQIIVFSQSKADNLMEFLKSKPTWNRLIIPEDPNYSTHGEQGRTSHDIKLRQAIINSQEINKTIKDETNQKTSSMAAEDLKESKMIENIVQTGMAFVVFRGIYISLMKQLKNNNISENDLEEADNFASGILDTWMSRQGLKVYRGSLTPSAKTIVAVAQDRSQELETIKKQLVDFGHTPQEIESILNQLRTNPKSIETTVKTLIKILRNPKEIYKLSKNNPNSRKDLRRKLEEKISKQDFGHEIMLKLLKAADEMTQEPT